MGPLTPDESSLSITTMNRQSAISRPSHAPTRSVASSQGITQRLNEKKQEYEAIAALDEAAAEITKNLEAIAAQGNIMADGGRGTQRISGASHV